MEGYASSWWKKIYTSAQLRKMQKKIKKSYAKVDKIKEKQKDIAQKEWDEADDLLEEQMKVL